MNTSDFQGFHFLPPSIRVPISWLPGSGTVMGMPTVIVPLASTGAALQHGVVPDHVLPLALGQS